MYVKTGLQSYCDTSYPRGDVNQMYILQNSKDLLEYIQSRSLWLWPPLKYCLFVWHCRPTLSAGGQVGRELFFFTFESFIFSDWFFTGTQDDINESNLMQHKEQQKSNSIFIKKNIFCLSVRQLNSEIRVLSIKSGNLTLNGKQI